MRGDQGSFTIGRCKEGTSKSRQVPCPGGCCASGSLAHLRHDGKELGAKRKTGWDGRRSRAHVIAIHCLYGIYILHFALLLRSGFLSVYRDTCQPPTHTRREPTRNTHLGSHPATCLDSILIPANIYIAPYHKVERRQPGTRIRRPGETGEGRLERYGVGATSPPLGTACASSLPNSVFR